MIIDIKVLGKLHGAGYRSFVEDLARGCGVNGTVSEANNSVAIKASGASENMGRFVNALRTTSPRGSVVSRLDIDVIDCTSDRKRELRTCA